ncbi:hypothetical protein Pcinc_041477 [Petrolisthes cinctipes]|uniref:Uncharacterized protein n=1 Tax=Petrolisthes cinctipes TaxID=88211 RepID=A0AAE1EJR9_PETCI|nr:hypothetical protein Pcinc_041477 [Petrolisthes cinctipes]
MYYFIRFSLTSVSLSFFFSSTRNHDESNSSSGGGVGGLGGSRYRGLSIRRRLSEAYGMVAPNVRRPSIRTDLLILRAKTSLHLTGIETFEEKKPRREVSCVIQ